MKLSRILRKAGKVPLRVRVLENPSWTLGEWEKKMLIPPEIDFVYDEDLALRALKSGHSVR